MAQSNPEHLVCLCPAAGACSGNCRPERSPISANADIQNNLPGPMSAINSPSITGGLNNLSNDIVEDKFCGFSGKAGYLTDSDIFALSAVSKSTQGLFQPNRLQMLADKLLLQVMHGEQDKAEVILKIRPDLLMIKGTATDYSGRTFHCTAFQYALWALDTRYMCNMMLDCVPNSPDAKSIQEGLLKQLLAHEQDGLEYQLAHDHDSLEYQLAHEQDGLDYPLGLRTVREKHYDFTQLVTALKTYVDNYDHWYANLMWARMHWKWCGVVGLAQRYVPAHVAQHYCDPYESFAPTPEFNKPKFTRVLQFYNYLTRSESHWFSPGGSSAHGLGVDFGITRGACLVEGRRTDPMRARAAWPPGWGGSERPRADSDLSALTALCQVRTKDLEPLKERLQSPLQKPKAESVSSCVNC